MGISAGDLAVGQGLLEFGDACVGDCRCGEFQLLKSVQFFKILWRGMRDFRCVKTQHLELLQVLNIS